MDTMNSDVGHTAIWSLLSCDAIARPSRLSRTRDGTARISGGSLPLALRTPAFAEVLELNLLLLVKVGSDHAAVLVVHRKVHD